MMSVVLEPTAERRVIEGARSRGISEAEFLRELIEYGLEDLADIQIATERLANPHPSVSSAEARKRLGLDH